MAQASKTDDPRERAVSSEPCSTRPNPFDDSDISSRKRRRTSASGASRSRSVETITSIQGEGDDAAVPATESELHANNDSAMKVDTRPTLPTTPEQQPLDLNRQPPSGPRSSRVTINVRTPSRALDAIPSFPPSPASPILQDPVPEADNVQVSVENPEVDIASENIVLDTPVSSGSDASSPPVELVEVGLDDDNDEVDFGTGDPQVTILDGIPRSHIHDPSGDFPFRDTNESYLDTIGRLCTYFTTHETVSRNLSEWIDSYLMFAKDVSPGTLMDSFSDYREMWLAIPDLVNFVIHRKSPYPRPVIRHEIFRFYKSFAKLTALFIVQDLRTLRNCTEEQSRLPELASLHYVTALGTLTRKDEVAFHTSQHTPNPEDGFSFYDGIGEVLDAFQNYPASGPGGALVYMKYLARIDAGLVPRFPKLTDHLAALSVLTLNILHQNSRRLQPLSPQVTVEQARMNIVRGYTFYKVVAPALEEIVEKHVNHLSYDGASTLLMSLTEIYFICLSTDHIVPAELIREHRINHPPIASGLLPDALAYRWKFTIFAKLIMSSQMQLRVMAATQMCNDLVQFYRRFNEQSEEHNPAFLTYIADFLLQSGLVAYILSAKCHPEVTTESSNIIGFLLVSQTYTPEHTDSLWRTVTSTQDPRISDALIKMVTRITNLFLPDGLMYLCEKMRTIPVESFGTTMREFCEQIFRHLLPKSGMYDRPIAHSAPYDLCIRLIRQASIFGPQSPVAYPDIHQFAMQKFRDLLAVGITVESRRKIYFDCLGDIAQKTSSTIGSLWVLYLMTRSHAAREIQALASDHNLTTLLIEELEAAIPAAVKAGFPPVLSGSRNTPRKELLFNVLLYEPSTIPKDLGPKLWHLLVGPGATCQEDRDIGWQLLNNSMSRALTVNPFTSICFSEYMPTLPPECFCAGAHEFIREGILPLVNDAASIILDDEENGNHAGIEQLWRIILTAPEGTIEQQAINTLVAIYLDSGSILLFPHYRARKVHLSLVNRCLQQLSAGATTLKKFGDGSANGDDGSMVIVATDQQILEQKLLFIRSLSVLREFHSNHQVKSHFSAPDLRPIILDSPKDVEGESAELKYQSFDGDMQTDVKPLNIGRRNTAASLFASLREATGFDNYRIYYRGRPFVPQENEICKSLEDLQIHNGIILVKRESDVPSSPTRARPGASRVEVEILGHFEELWEYLSMEEKLAREIYCFLVKLPVDEDTIEAIENPSTSYESIFPIGQPYKSMYAVHALRQYHAKLATNHDDQEDDMDGRRPPTTKELTRVMSLVVSAISDPRVITQCPSIELQIELGVSLVECFRRLLDSQIPESTALLLDGPLLSRLLDITAATLSANTSEVAAKNVSLCLQSILDSCSIGRAFMSEFCAHPEIPRLFEDLLLHDPRATVRNSATKLILEKIGEDMIDDGDPITAKFRQFFWPLVSGLVGVAITTDSHSDELLDLCLKMFKVLRLHHSPILDTRQLLKDWGTMLLSYTTTEDVTQPDKVDQVAFGLVRLLHAILCDMEGPSQQEMLTLRGVTRKIFWKHLFPPFEVADSDDPPRPILSTESRTLLMDIIISIVKDDPTQITWLLEDLDELVPVYPEDEGTNPLITSEYSGPAKKSQEFYAYELVQQFERQKAIKSSCGYVGLKNLSNTCYFNSLLTQLFMNTGFRQFVLKASVQDNLYSQGLLFETQKLFAFMQASIRRSMNPEDVIASIKTYEDTQIDIHNQMDVDEFYNLLFDRWEGQLLTSEEKRQFRSFYGGQLVQQVTSKECEHISERLEPFSAIQCDIKGKTSLEESLQAYVDGEIMEGDNKYKCSTCDRHVDAVKRACLKDIPDNLIFHLKRFDFNLRTLQRNKINDYFAFPTTIDMQPYTIEHLSGRAEDKPKDIFELVGVLVHSGTAESGHYYSYVRERPSSTAAPSWVEFNDENVGSWDPANMEGSCFGGPDLRTHFESNSINYEKNYSAYMLFYQRSTSLAKAQSILKQSSCTSPLRVAVNPDLERVIQAENNTLLRRHCLYDPAHIQLVQMALSYLKSANQDKCSRDHVAENLAITMALSHLDQVASRTKDVPDVFSLVKHITAMCQSCTRCSLAAYQYFDRYTESLRMLVQRNIDSDVRQSTANMVLRVLQVIKARQPFQYGIVDGSEDSDEDELESEDRPTVIDGMMLIFGRLWDNFHVHIRAWPEVFEFMLAFVKMGRHETAAFLKHQYFRYLLLIIYADLNAELPQQFARMISTISRRAATRPPSYESILDLIDELIGSMQFVTLDHGEVTGVDNTKQRLYNLRRDEPFYFTKAEVKILQMDWTRTHTSIFFEKLISINQNHRATYSIIGNLISYSRQMEDRVFRALKCAIGAHVSPHSNQPFLQVAAHVFCRTSTSPEMINSLIAHICSQCMALQNAEGKAFLDFQQEVFGAPRENSGEDPEDILMASYQILPEWAPGLLGYYDSSVSLGTEAFLQEKVFKYGPTPAFEDTEQGRRRAEKIIETARALGLRCLEYLSDNFIHGRGDVSMRLVAGLQRVIKESTRFFNSREIPEDEATRDFFRLSQVTLGPLQRIVVEDIEEDGSEWDGSSACSEQMDSLGDISMPAVNDLNDGDLQ